MASTKGLVCVEFLMETHASLNASIDGAIEEPAVEHPVGSLGSTPVLSMRKVKFHFKISLPGAPLTRRSPSAFLPGAGFCLALLYFYLPFQPP